MAHDSIDEMLPGEEMTKFMYSEDSRGRNVQVKQRSPNSVIF
jgi:hypothetical protein